jgi:hypothetical protein
MKAGIYRYIIPIYISQHNETVNNLPPLKQINFTRNDKPEYTVNFPQSNVSFELNYIYFRYMT